MLRPRPRHLALNARRPYEPTVFSREYFCMDTILSDPDGNRLPTDGYLTLALLKPRTGSEASMGMNHFGSETDDVSGLCASWADAGAEGPVPRAVPQPFAKDRATGPEGYRFDLGEHRYGVR